jgi:hypothetical protein
MMYACPERVDSERNEKSAQKKGGALLRLIESSMLYLCQLVFPGSDLVRYDCQPIPTDKTKYNLLSVPGGGAIIPYEPRPIVKQP